MAYVTTQQRTELYFNPSTIRETKLGVLYSCGDADDIPFLAEIGDERRSKETREMQGVARKALAKLVREVHKSDERITLQHCQALARLYGSDRTHAPKNPDQRKVIADLLTLNVQSVRRGMHHWPVDDPAEQAMQFVGEAERALFWMEQWNHLRELDMCGSIYMLVGRLSQPQAEYPISPLKWDGWTYASHWHDVRFDVGLTYGHHKIDGLSREELELLKLHCSEAFWRDLRYITGKQFTCGLGIQKNREEMLLTTTYLCTRTVTILREKNII